MEKGDIISEFACNYISGKVTSIKERGTIAANIIIPLTPGTRIKGHIIETFDGRDIIILAETARYYRAVLIE